MLSIKDLKSKQVGITINLPINGTHSSKYPTLIDLVTFKCDLTNLKQNWNQNEEFKFIDYYELFSHNN